MDAIERRMSSSEKDARNQKADDKWDLFHVSHKIPSGDTPYGKAKHAQIVEKNPEAALVWFWKAINSGDRVDSALKDMVVVMKQLNRSDEAIEALKSFRGLCSKNSQHSLDNLLLDLYKKCGRMDEHIELIKQKLRTIYNGDAFNGRPTKTARSHGKKFQVSVQQEISRLLGNMGWAYMQKGRFLTAEVVYKKAQMFDPDANKACNLAHCLIQLGRYDEARTSLDDVLLGRIRGSDESKPRIRAQDLLLELESRQPSEVSPDFLDRALDELGFVEDVDRIITDTEWSPTRSKRLPIFEEISSFTFRDQLAC